MSHPAICIENLGKRYQIGQHERARQTFREAFVGLATAPINRFRRLTGRVSDTETFWALRDVSFKVGAGEVVGIIGRNGAGKSTLLKILSQITEPTVGCARIHGRVGALLEVGTGFHSELSGRENVFLNGSILGMNRREIARKFDEIVDFAGVEKFIDTPVKHYSSGMKVRLGFAVAAYLEPEILIVDEVLAVGDAEFQRKCLGKMQDVAGAGRTVLFVSHNMGAVRTLCDRGVILRQGRLAFDGPVSKALDEYVSYLDSDAGLSPTNPERSGNGHVRLVAAVVLDANGRPSKALVAGTPILLNFEYQVHTPVSTLDIHLTIFDSRGQAVTHLSTRLLAATLAKPRLSGTVQCRIPKLPFLPGRYRVAAQLQSGGTRLDLVPNALMLDVDCSVFFHSGRLPDPAVCTCMVEHEWTQIDDDDDPPIRVESANGHQREF